MEVIYNLYGEKIPYQKVRDLFSSGYPVFSISWKLGIPQFDIASALKLH